VKRTFGATEESVGKARRFVSRLVSDLPDDLKDAVYLMVSELATNALVHASSGFDVDVDRSDVAVTVSVTDRGNGTPTMQSPAATEPHGRGLRIVEALSDEWGTGSSHEAGKTVWFQMALRQAGDEQRPDESVAMAVRADEETANPSGDRTSSPSSRPPPGLGRSDRPEARSRMHRKGPRLTAPIKRRPVKLSR
jgi:anti-sigma regulatory factor (Ser/Thr protein kinase)